MRGMWIVAGKTGRSIYTKPLQHVCSYRDQTTKGPFRMHNKGKSSCMLILGSSHLCGPGTNLTFYDHAHTGH